MYTVVKYKRDDVPGQEFSFAVIGDLNNVQFEGIEETGRYETDTLPLEADVLLDANKEVLVEFSTPHGESWRGGIYGAYRDGVHYTVSVDPKSGTMTLPGFRRNYKPGYLMEVNGYIMPTDSESGYPVCPTLPMKKGIEYLGSDNFEVVDSKHVIEGGERVKFIAVMWKGHYRFKAVDVIDNNYHVKYFSNAQSAVFWLSENEPNRRYPDDKGRNIADRDDKPKFDLAKVIWPVLDEYHIEDICFVSDTVVYFAIGASKVRVTVYNNPKRVSSSAGRQEWKDVRMLEYAIIGSRYHDHIKLEYESFEMAIESLRRFVSVFY